MPNVVASIHDVQTLIRRLVNYPSPDILNNRVQSEIIRTIDTEIVPYVDVPEIRPVIAAKRKLLALQNETQLYKITPVLAELMTALRNLRVALRPQKAARKDMMQSAFGKTNALAAQLTSLLQMMVVSDDGNTPQLKQAGQAAAQTLKLLKQAQADRERRLRS
jgi:hypothetical protein